LVARSILYCLVVGVLALPIVLCVVLGVARLLAALADTAGAAVLDRLALGLAVVWTVNLVGLIAALGVEALGRPRE
jgi:hypothetical protein